MASAVKLSNYYFFIRKMLGAFIEKTNSATYTKLRQSVQSILPPFLKASNRLFRATNDVWHISSPFSETPFCGNPEQISVVEVESGSKSVKLDCSAQFVSSTPHPVVTSLGFDWVVNSTVLKTSRIVATDLYNSNRLVPWLWNSKTGCAVVGLKSKHSPLSSPLLLFSPYCSPQNQSCIAV